MTRRAALALLPALLLLPGCEDADPVVPVEQVPITDLLDGGLEAVVNPSGVAPLTAEIRFGTRTATTAAYTVLAPEGGESLERSDQASATEHVLPVLGLYPGTENRVEVRLTTSESFAVDTVALTTDPLPDFLPEVVVTTHTPAAMEPGWTLSNLALGLDDDFATHPIVFDGTGAIRWYLDLSELEGIGVPFERLENGNLAAGFEEHVFEFDMLGNVAREWNLGPTYSQHHEIVELPDGDLLIAVDKDGTGTVEDHVIVIDRESGQVVREWDLRQVMDVHRTAYVDDAEDWLHVNSVWYDEADGGLVISARHQGVFKVSAANELVWILAPHRGWGPAGANDEGPETADFLLTAVDADGIPYGEAVQDGAERTDDFDWSWGQHAAMILPGGTLWLFDNGDDRHFTPADPGYSRGVEYAVDPEAMTVRQVWEYGRERGGSYFASFVSDVDYLEGTGNRLVMPGIVRTLDPPRAYVTEVAPDGTVVFEAEIRFKNLLGARPDLVYRSERMTIHPE